MNHKADRALALLRTTRTADLAHEFRNQRLLLEARALSDLGRSELALEVIAHVDGREAIRLRSDILWTARRWAPAAEQIELYYGDRWKEWQPLNDIERADILRAAIGFALGEDTLGLGRLREKYAAKMAETPDARAFEIVSARLGTSGAEFRDIARAAASIDTLDGFLRDMQVRYPDASPVSPSAPTPAGAPQAGRRLLQVGPQRGLRQSSLHRPGPRPDRLRDDSPSQRATCPATSSDATGWKRRCPRASRRSADLLAVRALRSRAHPDLVESYVL